MLSTDLLLAVCLGYVALLFTLAFYVDRRARQGGLPWMRSPVVYTLSISIYCTSWTFYGAVGSAARNGLEFTPSISARPWSSSAGGGCCASWSGSAAPTASPRSPT